MTTEDIIAVKLLKFSNENKDIEVRKSTCNSKIYHGMVKTSKVVIASLAAQLSK